MNPDRVTGSEPGHAGGFFDLVVIAASAGGLDAIRSVLACLLPDFSASVIVLLHLSPHRKSNLVDILARYTRLEVRQAAEKDRIQPGVIYVAPPDFHTLVTEGGFIALEQSAPVHFTRPSADRLFVSAAACYGKRTIGVVLSGMGQDGSQGIVAIKQAGGMSIAQNQATAEFYGMPGAAIRSGQVDFILPLDQIPRVIYQLVQEGTYPI